MARQNLKTFDHAQEAQVFEEVKRLTHAEAVMLRERHPPISVWRVVCFQMLVAVGVAGLAWMLTGRLSVMVSAAYGGFAVVLPAAMFARALSRSSPGAAGGAVLASFAVWELAKIGLTLAMLLLAPRLVVDLSWLALVAGFVVTMKVYWLAMLLRLTPTSAVKKNGR